MRKVFSSLSSLVVCLSVVFTSQAQTLLFDNGSFVTGVGNGFGGANTSAIETGYNTFGQNWNQAANFFIADDFTVPEGCPWRVTRIKWYGYQTGSPPTSTFTNAYAGIFEALPADPSLAGTIEERTFTSSFTNVYRVSADPLNNQRPIMELVIEGDWMLEPGRTYWLVVAARGTVASGPWSNPVVPHRDSDNAMQWNPGLVPPAWQQVDGSTTTAGIQPYDYPFKLLGHLERDNGDVNCDGCVDDSDLLAVLFAFGTTGAGLQEDLDGNGSVDDADLLEVLFNFGNGC